MFKHLRETNQQYLDHAVFALSAGVWLVIAGVASVIHAVLPNALPFVAERITKRLADQSQERQSRRLNRVNNQIS